MKNNKYFKIILLSAACLFFHNTAPCTAAEPPSLPDAASAAEQLYSRAQEYAKNESWLQAKDIYLKILNEYPGCPQAGLARKKLGATNIRIIRSAIPTPERVEYTVQPGDTVDRLARRFNTTVDLIKTINGLKDDIIRSGQTLRIWAAAFTIAIDKSENTLTLKISAETIKTYPVATGADNITPVGEFTITSRLKNPVWFHKGEIIQPDNPRNALGSRWLGLDNPQYGIHGTIQPDLIGQQVSHGCVRMLNKDVEELFDIVPLGTKVVIID
ncbi:MAG: L,D-transpeptidase family protein [Candidatus Omnitrophica bacterium]|nr:L,D-transpeptidase family protein [Candidatus Omnitrophota bacterium]MBU4479557.1 L,D-transpeptidase family protein [Candidatus Omnitrophota bacterium]MCG2704418.1 L,D-transpeptidase family protein [Candidatus Omnitrophota bacterium]